MADAVPFNYNTFVATFPAFAALPQQQAQLYWNMAGGYWRNDGTSPATTDAEQATLMNLVTAHLAQILGAAAAAAPSAGLVGPSCPGCRHRRRSGRRRNMGCCSGR
jgi:hypothetical protein